MADELTKQSQAIGNRALNYPVIDQRTVGINRKGQYTDLNYVNRESALQGRDKILSKYTPKIKGIGGYGRSGLEYADLGFKDKLETIVIQSSTKKLHTNVAFNPDDDTYTFDRDTDFVKPEEEHPYWLWLTPLPNNEFDPMNMNISKEDMLQRGVDSRNLAKDLLR